MTKRTGLGDRLYVSGVDLSGDIGALNSIGAPRAVLPVTGINKEAMERLHGHRDGSLEFTAFFNDAAGAAHPTLKTLPTADRVLSYLNGADVGRAAASMVGKQINYDGTRGEDGSLTFAVQAQANGFGLDWGTQLTAGQHTLSGAANLTALDFGADQPGNFDAQAYLHVFAFTGTDATIKIQTSQDNSGDPYTDRIAFAQVTTAPQAQRATMTSPGSQVMERFARVAVTTSGGFTNLVFAVALAINQVA